MRDFVDDARLLSARQGTAPLFSDSVAAVVLAANTAERVTIPVGASFVAFSGDGDFYVLPGDSNVTATVPTDSAAGSAVAVLNPGARRVPAGVTHISVIATATRIVTVEFWS